MRFRPHQSAAAVHEQLKACVRAIGELEDNLVRWYGDMKRRRLYRELGYSTMTNYAVAELDFSATRASDLSTLVDRLEQLPRLREAVESGQIGFTKARAAARVASKKTDAHWCDEALRSTRDELEQKARQARRRATARHENARKGLQELLPVDGHVGGLPGRTAPGQAGVRPSVANEPAPQPSSDRSAGPDPGASPALDQIADAVPCRVSPTLTSEQKAVYDGLWDRLGQTPRAEDLLEALALLLEARQAVKSRRTTTAQPGHAFPPGGKIASRPMIHLVQCPECRKIRTMHGQPLDPVTAEKVQCDAILVTPGKPNRATIAPSVRQMVLERDGYQCRGAGCRHRLLLEVHHLVPRSKGGSNQLDNLVTLCRSCHHLVHEIGTLPLKPAPPRPTLVPPSTQPRPVSAPGTRNPP